MIQCFVKKEYEPPFGLTRAPRLFSVSRTDAEASAHPRVMHAHDDLVEIVLVRGGESRYFVGGMPYDARRGDLFIYNSRVVHDEPSGPDRPVASFSLALGGLNVPGLRENALIPDEASPVCPLTEEQTVRLERLYDVLYGELTAGNDDGAHHLLMALLTLVRCGAGRQPGRKRVRAAHQGLHRQPFFRGFFAPEHGGRTARQSVLSGARMQGCDRLLAAAICAAPPHRGSADAADYDRPAGDADRGAGRI